MSSSDSFGVPAPSRTSPPTGAGVLRGDTGLLRLALRLDAVATGAVGAAALIGCAALDSALGLPAAFLAGIGVFLVLYALFVARAGSAPVPDRGAVWVVIGGNLAWFALSAVTAAAGWLGPTGLGTVMIVIQAVAVLGFADLQFYGLRRARESAA
ncbi:hypothetical protein [Streptomyces sp. NP-1717]|uniref:hypothetical protein n=1 Tax=Streptomyces sp. NP-1717 TaxID=2704470 RepID=UPI001F5CA129|nr:hypothetical protein [Streptomyces sp. NP-1717]MCI3220622.1 hypothetical protein [Streptomyces sp. NP-1717]